MFTALSKLFRRERPPKAPFVDEASSDEETEDLSIVHMEGQAFDRGLIAELSLVRSTVSIMTAARELMPRQGLNCTKSDAMFIGSIDRFSR